MGKVYISGHRNPDSDCTLSGIVYGKYLDLMGIHNQVIRLGELNNETKFILDKFDVDEVELKQTLENGSDVILMDHNEASQSIGNLEKLNIVEIIDHHKFKLETSSPLKIRAEPIGSTCSIVAKILFEQNVEISQRDASLLISGIVSDTLYFRSPTTTSDDRQICEMLNKIAQILNLEKYSLEMFNAKSDLRDISAEKLVKLDYKVFNFGGCDYGIGVMETTNLDYGINRKDEILEKMAQIKQKDHLNGIFFSIIDIINQKNLTLVCDEEDAILLKKLFEVKVQENVADLGNVVSRKKQIIPVFEKALN